MIRRISYLDVKIAPALVAEYAEECSIPEIGKPDPQWEMYAALEQAGLFHAFGVYVDGSLAGFAGVVIALNPHFGVLIATMESLFVGKAFRKSGAGTELMRAVKVFARDAGCKAMIRTAPAGGQLEALLGKQRKRTGSVFCEALDEHA